MNNKENTLLINNFDLVWDFYKNSIKDDLENYTQQPAKEMICSLVGEKNAQLATDSGLLSDWKWGLT